MHARESGPVRGLTTVKPRVHDLLLGSANVGGRDLDEAAFDRALEERAERQITVTGDARQARERRNRDRPTVELALDAAREGDLPGSQRLVEACACSTRAVAELLVARPQIDARRSGLVRITLGVAV